MAQVKIVTDSTAMLTPEEAAEFDVKIVPLSITIDGTSYQDGVTLSRVEFMDKMAEAKNLPQTSQPALGYFTEVYESIMAADPETQIISIHLTKGLSGTADAARQAALMVEGDITTLDAVRKDSKFWQLRSWLRPALRKKRFWLKSNAFVITRNCI